MLLGNTLFNIGSSALLTTVLVAMVGESGALYATAAMTVLLLVFAEVLPKTVAINYPDQISLLVARGSVPSSSRFSARSSYAVEKLVRGALYLCGLRLDEKHPLLSPQEELKSAVDPDAQGGRRRPLRPRHVRRPARPQGAGRLRRHGPSHQDGRARRRRCPAPNSCAKSSPRHITRVPLWRGDARQHHRRAARQGSAARARRRQRRRRARSGSRRSRSRPGSCRIRPRSKTNCRPFASAKPISRWSSTNMATCRAW